MANILVPVERGQDVMWLVNYLQKIHQRDWIRVHLLSVQPRYSSLVRLFFSMRDLEIFSIEDAACAIAPLKEALDRANIPYNCHIRTGDKATEIVKLAKEVYSPQIVLGPTSGNWILDMIFGTLAARLETLIRHADTRCEVL